MPDNQVEKIRNMLEDFDTAMLITHGTGGLRARPMAIAQVEPSCDVWFFTDHETTKVHEIERNQEVLVACQNDHSKYLSLRGSADVVEDRALVRQFWKESFRTWFPDGVDDPRLTLLRVYVREGEYWDSRGLKGVRYMFEAAKAYATGTRPHIQEGEQHGRTVLK